MKMFKSRKRLKLFSISLAIVIIVMIVSPFIVKNYIINNSKELIGRQIALGSLKYNYFSSTARIYDFKMFEKNEKDIFVSFDTAIVNLEPLHLIFNEKNLEQFYVKGLTVNTVLMDSTFNFDDLIAFHTAVDSSKVVSEKKAETFKYDLSNLELKDASFYFDNKNVNKVTEIEDFSFFIPEILWDQTQKSNADLKFNFKPGGYFKSTLNINPVDGEFDAKIEINQLYLNAFDAYVKQYADINEFSGVLNGQVEIIGNTNNPTKAIVSGTTEVTDFSMKDRNNKAFLKANRMNAELRKMDYSNSSYEFGAIDLTEPYIYFEMDSITNNFFQIFKLDDYSESEAEVQVEAEVDRLSEPELFYAIDNLKVNAGLMDYSDNLTGNRFDYHLNNISIDSDSISSKSDWIDIYADMLLNNRGTLKSKLGINPNAYDNLKLDMVIENFLLSDINIYANYYVGHDILLGDFYYYSKSNITNGEVLSENQLLVKNVSVENTRGGLFSLPLKFALFLLKDKNGDVNLNVPVRGNMNDPEVNIGKLVWTTLKNKITGAASDPISSLAGLVGVNPKDYKELVFEYTDTIPSESQYEKLDKLLEMETEKEGLKVTLEHYVDPDLQKDALAISALGQQYETESGKNYLEDVKGFEKYIKNLTQVDSMNLKDAAMMYIDDITLNELSQNYNSALLRNINAYLKNTKPDTNIKAVASKPEEPDNTGSQNRFKINFDMLTVMADDPTTEKPMD
jgi:hypothetical protein